MPNVPTGFVPPIARQLACALEGPPPVSQRELARRLAGDGATEEEVENERRHLGKILRPDQKDGVRAPRPKTLAEIEAALNLPAGHFVVPPRLSRAMLEEQVAAMRDLLVSMAKEQGKPIPDVLLGDPEQAA